MNYADGTKQMATLRTRIAQTRAEMRKLQQAVEPQEVPDYALATTAGPVTLSALFGAKRDLFVVHNMGSSCPYCTLWADGYNGVYEHLADRASFVVTSPDAPGKQERFARGRGWRFPMASHQGTSFAADMGYRSAEGGWLPGISAFKRDGKRILRVNDTGLQPGDDFCMAWHLFDLLPEGAAGWGPRFAYDRGDGASRSAGGCGDGMAQGTGCAR